MSKIRNNVLKNLENLNNHLITPEKFTEYSNIPFEVSKRLSECSTFEEMLQELESYMNMKHARMYRNIPREELEKYEEYLTNELSASLTNEEAMTNFWNMDEQMSFILQSRRDIEEDDKDLFATFDRAYNHSIFVWECFAVGLISLSTLQDELEYISGKYNMVLSLLPTINRDENAEKVQFIEDAIKAFNEYQETLEVEGPDNFLNLGSSLLSLEDEKLPDSIRFDWYDENIDAEFVESFCRNLERKMQRKIKIAKKRNSR